jgi:hypothetical protein
VYWYTICKCYFVRGQYKRTPSLMLTWTNIEFAETMEEFNPPELQEGNDCTLESTCLESLETSPVMLPTKRTSDMPDCPQITEEKKVKLGSSIDSTQKQKSLNIPEVGSISEKKGLYPFWSESIQEKSKNYCLIQWQIVKIWFWTLGIHLQKSCLQDRDSQQS